MYWYRLFSLERLIMIYASFTKVYKIRSYRNFCFLMDIITGRGAAMRRTPAEARTVAQFLLAVNSNRRAVFVNLNKDLAVFVEPLDSDYPAFTDDFDVGLMQVPPKGQAEIAYERQVASDNVNGIGWDLVPYDFIDLTEVLRDTSGWSSKESASDIAKAIRKKLDGEA